VDLAAADVHVVRERVRELRRERADLAPDAPEVVEEPRALRGELGQELGEAEDVDGADDNQAGALAIWQKLTHSETVRVPPARRSGLSLSVSATLEPQVSARASSPEATSAAADLYERYYDRVFGYCLYQLGSREEAEDAAQTTFMWAYRGLRRGVVPRAEASWLFTIAQNACRARHRARGRRREREVVRDPQLLAELAPARSSSHEELIGLEDALARMPELQRRAILLREWRGLSYKEIATELDLTGAAVETLIFRARRSLAQLLSTPQTPKRARRYAFDLGSLGAALKAFLGTGTAAKVAAGVAAAVVAVSVAGSVEQPRPAPHPAKQPSTEPLSLSERDSATPTARKPTRSAAAPREAAHEKHRAKSGPPAEDQSQPEPLDTLQKSTQGVPRVLDTGDAVGQTVDTLKQTVDDMLGSVTGVVPEALGDDLAPLTGELAP
jgi:RNA polymerase sigma-70 factor, ECF subfamily